MRLTEKTEATFDIGNPEITSDPFISVIRRYGKQVARQVHRAERRNRPLLPKEKQVMEYAGEAIRRIGAISG